ncbi:hypothetical protein [Saccharomonospora glauca]|jgi:hypothetical protein|uniref:Uncharacterized protein n=1 Tax=Saccharomonospora glauca K62 TaxID=928724 RepID=I1D4L2_9PSEU|nr:hypothetical protein [Saccharomonospora glauca]EIE99886.1 hypothetical protein SacglDRAFT_03018 [Saccharomonospora glauca K62]
MTDMLLWDREMASVRPQLGQLTPTQRYAAAVQAIENTMASFDPPIPDSPAGQLLQQCFDIARSAVNGNHAGLALPDGAEEELTSIVAEGAEPGIAPLVLAVANCFGLPEDGMEAEHLYTVLNYCYAAVVDRAGLEEGTLEEELNNPQCRAAITMQKELITG